LKEQYRLAAGGGRGGVLQEVATAAAVSSMVVGGHDVSPSSSTSIRRYYLRSATSSSASTPTVADQNNCPNAAISPSSLSSSLSGPKHRGPRTSSPSATGENSVRRRYSLRTRSTNNIAPGRVDATPTPPSPFTERVLHVWGNRNKSADKFRKVKELIENGTEIKSNTAVMLETNTGPITFNIGHWISQQRYYYHARKLSLLSLDRIEMLREIRGFDFGEGSLEQRWMNRLNELKDFKEVYEHCNVPRDWHENPQLGIWVMEQRTKMRKNTLEDYQLKELNLLGFSWERFKDQWDDRYEELVEFKRKYHHTNASRYGPQTQLGSWVSTQRQNMVRGESRLTEERIAKLDDIGFDWSPLQGLWDMRYQELLEFKVANGHTIVPRPRKGASPLSHWVHTQRVKKDWLIEHYPDRVALLEDIGFTWHVPIYVWTRRYDELKAIYDKYRHTRVNSKENLRLYDWCVHQRDLAVRGTLELGKRLLLEAINFDFYKREVSQKYVRIEWKFMHELMAALDEIGVDSDNLILDRCYEDLRKRPDGVITINGVEIFVEVDEEAHDPNQGSGTYELPKDEDRMVNLYGAAMKKSDVESVVFIRINTGMLRNVYSPQIETVISVFESIIVSDAPAAGGCHVYYIDYDEDDAHVQEAQEEKYRFEVRTIHTTGFNPTAYRIEERGDKSTT
jgi:hypothetical protein